MYDDLIKRLRYCRNNAAVITDDELMAIADQATDAIEELSKPRWIPVTERLPEKHEWVLVRSKLVKMKTDFISNDGNWYTTPGVTHWMPLPEPPEKVSEG